MGNPLYVTFSSIYMVKPQNEIVVPLKPTFYRRYVYDIFFNDWAIASKNQTHHQIKLKEIPEYKFYLRQWYL